MKCNKTSIGQKRTQYMNTKKHSIRLYGDTCSRPGSFVILSGWLISVAEPENEEGGRTFVGSVIIW